MTTNLQELSLRLQAMADLARQSDGSVTAQSYAGAVMREGINPLENLNNLVYLAVQSPQDSTKVTQYMDMAQKELLKLNEITKQTLYFCSKNHEPEANWGDEIPSPSDC